MHRVPVCSISAALALACGSDVADSEARKASVVRVVLEDAR